MRNQHCKKNCFQASNYMACNKISMHGFCLTNENLLPPPLIIDKTDLASNPTFLGGGGKKRETVCACPRNLGRTMHSCQGIL